MGKRTISAIKDRLEMDLLENCLVLPVLYEDKILDYQVEMISHNPNPRILPLEKRIIDNQIRLYYKINALIPLYRQLAGTVLSRDDFLNILESIAGCLTDCKRYFLYERCFLLDIEHLYIHPVSGLVSLLYVPLELEPEPLAARFNALIDKLLAALRLDDSSDNLVFNKKIYGFQNREPHHADYAAELAQLIKELKFPRERVRPELSPPLQKPFMLDPACGIPSDLEQAGKEEKEKSLGSGKRKNIFLMVLAQAVFLFVLTIFTEKLDSLGDPKTTYAGIAMALTAVNIFFLYKLFNKSFFENKIQNKKKEGKHQELQALVTKALAKENKVIKQILKKY